MTSESGEISPVVVKFANTYGTAAHIVCEQAECAPALIHESQVTQYCYNVIAFNTPVGLSLQSCNGMHRP